MPDDYGIRVIAFEAQVRYRDESTWFTLRVSRQWSVIEEAAHGIHLANSHAGPVVDTRIVIVDHSDSG